jgi:hypothetical protein
MLLKLETLCNNNGGSTEGITPNDYLRYYFIPSGKKYF